MRVREKESDKMDGEDRDGAYEERNRVEVDGEEKEEEEEQEKWRTTHLRLQSFSEKCEASAITVDHIPLSLRFHYFVELT